MRRGDLFTIENLTAWLCLVWGVFAINPYSDLFSKNPPLFAPMQSLISSEVFWGALFGLSGLVALALSYFGYRYSAAFLMTLFSALFASLYALGDFSQPGWAWFGSVAIVNLLTWGTRRWNLSR